ncbi:kettin homolog [Oppia nitens]|uniref:kettin homolog n=1 Tax=Oppia nitens TaxID=1686743 RepID=UPI0023DB7C10|nr:kettin homolog [Oppia nitens]
MDSYQTVDGYTEGDLAPVFVLKPEPLEVAEGENAKFSCRLIGNPKPLVRWYINDIQAVNGSKYKIKNDGIHQLEIPKTSESESGIVEVRAMNSIGEAKYNTTLEVRPRSDVYRAMLKNSPKPIYDDNVAKYQLQRRLSQESEKSKEVNESCKPGGSFGVWFQSKPQLNNQEIRRRPSSEGPIHPFHAKHNFIVTRQKKLRPITAKYT